MDLGIGRKRMAHRDRERERERERAKEKPAAHKQASSGWRSFVGQTANTREEFAELSLVGSKRLSHDRPLVVRCGRGLLAIA